MKLLRIIWRFILFPVIYVLFISAFVFIVMYFIYQGLFPLEKNERHLVFIVPLYGILIFNFLFFLIKPGWLKENRFLKLFLYCFGWFLVFGLAAGIFSYFIEVGDEVSFHEMFQGGFSRYGFLVCMFLFCLVYYLVFCFIVWKLAPWYGRTMLKWRTGQA